MIGPLRRVLRDAGPSPVVADLGFGASPVTAVELHERLRRVRCDVRLLGLEIDPERVAAAEPWASEDRVFALGGFEVTVPPGWEDPVLIRAFNVLRQYEEHQVPGAWRRLAARLGAGGLLIEGTCDEIGRLASWVTLDAKGPVAFTVSVGLASLGRPADVAERLPKALIHRNVPGERIHDWLQALDRGWELSAPYSSFGVRQRWLATIAHVRDAGWPVLHGTRRWRLGEVTVPWEVVAPR